MSQRAIVLAACLAAPAWASGQGYPPPEPSPYPPQQQPAPPQPAPAQPQQPGASAPSGSSSSTSGHTAAPGGAASQQVVVNPPQPQQPQQPQQPAVQQPPPPPPSSTTVVNPPASYGGYGSGDVIVERRGRERNPMATIATDAAYGGVAGLLVGVGVALVNEWDGWDRDIMIGAGAGLILGAGVGAVQATVDAQHGRRDRVAFDGLGRTARDPVVKRRPVVAFSGRF